MSSKKYLIGGILVLAAAVASVPLFLKDYRHISLIPSSQSHSTAVSSDILGTYDGTSVKRSNLTSRDTQSLFEAENQVYKTAENVIARKYFDSLIHKYMKDKKISDYDMASEMFMKEHVKVTDAEVKSFVQQNADNPQLKGKNFKQQEELVRPYLLQQASGNYFKEVINKAVADGLIQVTGFQKPEMVRINVEVGDAPFLGPKDAPITIVEFADFQCPYCSMAVPTVQEVMKKYDGKVKLVFKNFPLSFHAQAMNAAVAADCAKAQGKYWEMHDKLFENHAKLDDALYGKLATAIGLDSGKFSACMKDPKIKSHVEAELAYGQSLGINGTPAFYINGVQLMAGAQPKEEFIKVIDVELSKKK